MPRDATVLQFLAARLQDMEQAPRHALTGTVSTGWQAVNQALGGLSLMMVHEWFSVDAAPWLAPMGLLLHLAKRALDACASSKALWIGRRCWPAATDQPMLAGRFILLDVAEPSQRVWAAELALRCPSVACCVLDGQGLTMPMTRRLQIAASGGHALALVARPAREISELSAAGTRWRVTPEPGLGPRWAIELLRCKGMRHIYPEPAPWP